MARKKHVAHVNHERWLVSYADLLTLLFAFFVVLFASSVQDKKKTERMAEAMQVAFQQNGVFEPHSKTPPLTTGPGSSSAAAPHPIEMPIASAEGSGPGSSPGQGLSDKLAKSVEPATRQNLLQIRHTGEGTILSLDSAGFFDSGSAQVKASTLPMLAQIADSLPQGNLRVEGHTDNRPIHTGQFRSNWELSTARAAAIAEVLMRHSTVSPARFAIAGYAEFHPIAGNDTAAGRAANRRVDVVLLSGGSRGEAEK